MTDPAWERRHPDQPESWSFEFCAPDGSLGGYVAVSFLVAPRVAWYWAALVGDGRPYVLVRDLEVALPRLAASREVRAEGLWSDLNCETPFDHWSVGLEAFAVAMDDPDEALAGERGDRLGLGLDLEWEAAAGIVGSEGAYAQACAVHGDVLVGVGRAVEAVAFEGHGWRRHRWGDPDPLAPRSWLGGVLGDGTPWCSLEVARGDVEDVHRAPLLLEAGGRRARVDASLCRFPGPGGRSGLGWGEWLSLER